MVFINVEIVFPYLYYYILLLTKESYLIQYIYIDRWQFGRNEYKWIICISENASKL